MAISAVIYNRNKR